MSSKGGKPVGPAEPDPFDKDEFRAWRGYRRVHVTVEAELGRRLEKQHGLTVQDYGILITLVAAPDRQLRMTDLAEQVMASASGMTRAIARLCDDGFVDREQDPNDRRSVIASLTGKGVRKLRAAQVTHHKCAREVFFAGMQGDDIERLATIYEHAIPGVLDEPTWPPPGRSS